MTGPAPTAPPRQATIASLAAAARIAVGAVFVVAGVAKAIEPVHFYWEAISYVELLEVDRERWHQVGQAALALPPLEVLVGLALAIGWRLRVALPAAAVMLVLFLVLTGYAWLQKAEIDCGCFGTLAERSPGEAVVEDAVLSALLVVGWGWGARRWSAGPRAWAPRLVVAGALVTLAVVAFRFAPELERVASSDLRPGVRLTGLSLKGLDEPVDLGKGKHLVEVFSPRCPHCMRAVPLLNSWVDDGRLPRLIALHVFPPDSPYLADFVNQFRPRYPIASVTSADWKRLTWRHGWPRLAYVEDGVIRRVWEHDEMPSTAQLLLVTGAGQSLSASP